MKNPYCRKSISACFQIVAFLLFTAPFHGLMGQIPIPSTYPANGNIYPWGYQIHGTLWDTSPFIPLIYNRQPFRMVLPQGVTYNRTANTFSNPTGEKFPVVLFLHGVGLVGTDNGYQLSIGGKDFLDAFNAGKLRAIIVFPHNSTNFWGSGQQTNLVGIVNNLISKGLADPFAISVAGTSSGGTAVWNLLYSNRMVFASGVPMSAAASTTSANIQLIRHIPIWLAQGNYDGMPNKNTALALVNSITSAGGNIRYTLYSDLGHGTWLRMFEEPDFFSFFMRANKTNPHLLSGRTEYCPGDAISVRLGVTSGFQGYEWRKNGTLISGAITNEIVVTGAGIYDVRVRRSNVWSYWSPIPVEIKIKTPTITPPVQTSVLASVFIPDVNGNSNVRLAMPAGYTEYSWKRVGSEAVIGTAREITVSAVGNYVATVKEQFGCTSIPSLPFAIINANGSVAPPPAIDVTGYSISENENRIMWSQNPFPATNETGFEVWRSQVINGPYNLAHVTLPDITSFVDGGLNPNTNYYYKVRAINQNGASATTGPFTIRTNADHLPPTAPGNLRVTSTTKNSVSLTWLASTDDKGISNYEIYSNGKKVLVCIPATVTVFSLIENDVYNFIVKAKDLAGNISTASNQVTAIAANSGTPIPGSPPGPPPNLVAVATGYDQIDLSWDDTAVYETGFQIWRSTQAGTGFNTIATTEANVTEYHDQALSHGSTYFYKITAIGQYGESGFSGIATVTTSALPPIPSIPTGLISTALTPAAIKISFHDGSQNENAFEVFRSTQNNSEYIKVATLPSSDTGEVEFSDGGLFSNVQYYYKVRAINEGGSSGFSNESFAKTLNTPPLLEKTSDRTMRRGTTLTLPVKATDADGVAPSISVENLPSFATFTDLSNGVGSIIFNPAIQDTAVYSGLVIRAVDQNGGSDADTFNLTVNNNFLPVITTITNKQVKEGETLVIPITVTDPDGSVLTIRVSGLPSFATFTGNNGSGSITINPGFSDQGVFNIDLSAEDAHQGISTTRFSITVNDSKSNYRLLINFTRRLLGPSPWNNTAALPTAGLVISNLKDTDLENTAVSMTLVTGWGTATATGEGEAGTITGNNSGVYPDNVMDSYYYTNSSTYKTIRFSGLNKSLKYIYTFFSSRDATGNYTTEFRIGSSTVSLNASRNTTNTVRITDVVPNANGEVLVDVRRASGASYGYLNAMEIEGYVDNGLIPDAPQALSLTEVGTNTVTLNWQDKSNNETGFEIYRSLNGTTFTRITSKNSNVISHKDNTVSSKTGYFYKVRAINIRGVSGYSNTAFVTTLNLPPVVSAQNAVLVFEGATSSLNVSATDPDDASVSLILSNNPAFINLTQSGPLNGTLTTTPSSGDKGIYVVTVTALDGSGGSASRNITITVSNSEAISTYVNFCSTSSAPLPWNNMNAAPTVNLTRSNLVDERNVLSGINITLLDAWQGAATSGAVTGNNSGIFPDDVIRTSYYENSTATRRIQVNGLQAAMLYNFVFFGSRIGTGDMTTIYTIGTQSVSMNTSGNTNQTVQLSSIKPSAAGEVIIQIRKGSNAAYADINALVIQSFADTGIPVEPSELVVTSATKNSISLRWKDNSAGESGFEVWKSLEESGTYARITTRPSNAISFTDSNLQADQVYYYKVRAITTTATIYSPFSNIITGNTLAFSVYVNFNNFLLNAPAPWNNLPSGLMTGWTSPQFKDDAGNNTGFTLSVLKRFDGENTDGMNTGNNSGVYPDAVMRGSYYLEKGWNATLLISGLNFGYTYSFVFFGSRQGSGDKTGRYTIDNKSVSLNAAVNTTATVQINNVMPREDGTVLIDVFCPVTSLYAYINAIVINSVSVRPEEHGNQSIAGRMAGAAREIKEPITEDVSGMTISAYPNPFNDKINLQFEHDLTGNLYYEVYETTGRRVLDGEITKSGLGWEIDVSKDINRPGLYLLKVFHQNEQVRIFRIIKK